MTKKNINIEIIPEKVNFTIDASLIERLGRELVAKAETAVAELVKNAYDADATAVTVKFIDAKKKGGTLVILDNGRGMTYKELVNGFLRIASNQKKKNPVSKIFKRTKAGNKGIGRFATQRLGTELIIETKSLSDKNKKGYKLRINWIDYESGKDLSNIKVELNPTSLSFEQGTSIRINNLREGWTDTKIKRVFRYLTDLTQPYYLSDKVLSSKSKKNKFEIECLINENEVETELTSSQDVLNNSLAIIEGKIENDIGLVSIKSHRYKINDINEQIQNKIDLDDEIQKKIDHPNINFKAFYNINRKYKDYYEGYISKADYSLISHYNTQKGGIRLYKNGFRIMPYGEKGNDWISIDKTNDIKTDEKAYVPFSSKNFIGFVEIIDEQEKHFKETSSREGLIETKAFEALVKFINEALLYGAKRVNSARIKEKEDSKRERENPPKNQLAGDNTEPPKDNPESKNEDEINIGDTIGIDFLKVLATIGLSTGEFIHEIRQFVPSFKNGLKYLESKEQEVDSKKIIEQLKRNFNRFRGYTAYIDSTITKANEEKDLVSLDVLVNEFGNLMKDDLETHMIQYETELVGYDLLTKPMYAAEWDSILYNLYSNSKKAIFRTGKKQRKIKIIVGKNKDIIFLEFLDNGDGIPEKNHDRIFDAFFTTANKNDGFSAPDFEFTGTGLGLKIIKDIITAYNGEIFVAGTPEEFSTNVRIELPAANEREIDKYYG